MGGLEKDFATGAISNDPVNHERMLRVRAEKVARVADDIPLLTVKGNAQADTIVVGWGGTYGHVLTAVEKLAEEGIDVAMAQFAYINPLPRNTEEVLSRYSRVIVAELNAGQFATYLQSKIPQLNIRRINKVQGQPFLVQEIVDGVKNIMEEQ